MIELAAQAADLIPEPPTDVLNDIAWRELVWETARRLAVRGTALSAAPAHADLDVEFDGSATHLLQLAAMFQDRDTSAASSDTPPPETIPHRL